MDIRNATIKDLDEITRIEGICFPPSEAAKRDDIEKRLISFSECFWVLEDNEKIIGFINGMVTNEITIKDEMFESAALHTRDGKWQSVFGLDVLPEYRCKGYGEKLMKALITSARDEKRLGCILTCKEHLVHYYEKFGYKNKGVSASTHGGAVWYDMILEF